MPNTEPRGIDCADWTATQDKHHGLILTGNFRLARSVKGAGTIAANKGRAMEFFVQQFQRNGGCQNCFSFEGDTIKVTAPGSYAFRNWMQSHNSSGKNDMILSAIAESLEAQKRGEAVRAAASVAPADALVDQAPSPATHTIAPAPPVADNPIEVASDRLADVNETRNNIGMPPVDSAPKPYGNGPLVYFSVKRKPQERYDKSSGDFWVQERNAELAKQAENKAKGGRGKH